MNEGERKTIIDTMVQLVERRVRDRAWIYWPPGPMCGPLFNRERCYADVRQLVDTIQHPSEPTPNE